MLNKISGEIFLLLLVLIVVVYFAGSTKVIASLAGGIQSVSYAVTGRNAQGQFADYPKGA